MFCWCVIEKAYVFSMLKPEIAKPGINKFASFYLQIFQYRYPKMIEIHVFIFIQIFHNFYPLSTLRGHQRQYNTCLKCFFFTILTIKINNNDDNHWPHKLTMNIGHYVVWWGECMNNKSYVSHAAYLYLVHAKYLGKN
jgi:hypothetical protein